MSVAPPKLMWEASLGKEMSVDGATLRFVALGNPDKSDDTVVGWYVLLSRPDGEAKILMKTFNYEPRLLKTFNGLRSLLRDHVPTWTSVTLPLVPQVRAPNDIWKILDKMDSSTPQE